MDRTQQQDAAKTGMIKPDAAKPANAKPGKAKRRVRNLAVMAVAALVWLVLDQVTKQAAEAACVLGAGPVWDLPGIMAIELVHNRGAAWGTFSGHVDCIVLVTVLIMAVMAVWGVIESRTASPLVMLGFGLVLAGGAGNLIDRVASGYVVDMIEPLFIQFPTFNVADIGITCGFVVVAVALIVQQARSGASDPAQDEPQAQTPSERKDLRL